MKTAIQNAAVIMLLSTLAVALIAVIYFSITIGVQ